MEHPNWSYPDDNEIIAVAGRADPVACVVHLYGQALLERMESIALALEAIAGGGPDG
jgi:hypothetical protein